MRTARGRAKTLAALGIITMLFGALLVVAPGAAATADQSGNKSCAEILGPLGFTNIVEAKDDNGRQAPYPAVLTDFATVTSGSFSVKYRLDATGVTFKEASPEVYAVYVKQASENQDDSVEKVFADGEAAGFVAFTVGGFSHISFCTGTPGTTSSSSTSSTSTSSTSTSSTSTSTTSTSTSTTSTTTTSTTSTTAPPTTTTTAPQVLPDATASLTVVKAVTGDDAPSEWSFPFTVTVLGDLDLTNDNSSFNENGIDVGEYTITETDSGDADLVSIACTGDGAVVDLDAGTATVDLEDGDAVTCTFTNDFPDVQGSVVTNPPPAPAAEEPAVLGSQVVRSLPRTGSNSGVLVTVGVMLILLGAVLTVGSSRKLALER